MGTDNLVFGEGIAVQGNHSHAEGYQTTAYQPITLDLDTFYNTINGQAFTWTIEAKEAEPTEEEKVIAAYEQEGEDEDYEYWS